MKIFIDSADLEEIADAAAMGVLDGVTTNPSLVAKAGRPLRELIVEICELVDGPISAEVHATDLEGILREGRELAALHPNVVVKVPLIAEGLKAVRTLSAEGIRTNVTLCFSPTQALLAAKAGATMVSPFIGRLDDRGERGMALIEDIVTTFRAYPRITTQVLVASTRHADHVRQAMLLGADISTVPPKLLDQMVTHDLTDKGLAAFLEDWKKARTAAPQPA